ncbi:hypothetical protein Tco_0290374 [Tanacetum coccineum]
MDDPNITMEDYIRLEEEKALRRGTVYNWETAKYGKIWYDEDVHDLRFVETEFPAIVFNDALTSEVTPSCEPSVNSENDNDKVNMPSFPSPKPEVIYYNDLDFFKDFENEYPIIVYNDALTSKSDFLTEHIEPSERNDNVGGVFINLEISKCWSLEISRRLFNTLFAQELKLKNHPEQNIKGAFSF